MRLFAAVPVPPAVRTGLAASLVPLQPAAPPHLRWTAADDWHVTLAFYGQVADDRVGDLQARLRRGVARRPAPALRLGRLGTFGSTRAATVLWAGVEGDLDVLRSVAASARAAGRRVGLGGADLSARRPFRAHVTLARARGGADLRDLLAAAAEQRLPGGLAWRADEAVLVRSDLGQGADGTARYTVLARLPFRRAADPEGESAAGQT